MLRILMLILLLICTTGMAATDYSVTAKVTVSSIFSLSVDRDDINFDQMKPGESKMDIPATGIRVTSKSNHGSRYYLKVCDTEELNSGKTRIPNENFGWYGWSEGAGVWHGTGKETMSLLPQLAYTSSVAEGMNASPGIINVFKFKLDVPKNQQAGDYETIVKFVMTE